MGGCRMASHCKAVCRSAQNWGRPSQNIRNRAVHEAEQDTEEDKQIDLITIKSLSIVSDW